MTPLQRVGFQFQGLVDVVLVFCRLLDAVPFPQGAIEDKLAVEIEGYFDRITRMVKDARCSANGIMQFTRWTGSTAESSIA